jgi:alpha-D-xyloside xylohydrolase
MARNWIQGTARGWDREIFKLHITPLCPNFSIWVLKLSHNHRTFMTKYQLLTKSCLCWAATAVLPVQTFAAEPLGTNAAGQLVLTKELASAKPNVFKFSRLQNGVQIRVNGMVKNVLFYGPDMVRVNANLGQSHTTQPSLTVVLPPAALSFKVTEAGDSLELSTSSLRVIVDKRSGALTYMRPDGTILTRENAERPADIKEVQISGAPTYEVKQKFTLSENESLYGLGQYDKRYMDYRGQEVLMVQTNIGIVVPFMMSTKRYGIMWDIYSKSVFKDDASGASFWAESAPAGVDYYFIAGANMDGVVAGYRKLTGRAPMFPKSAFGLWMSKERYKTQDRLIEVVKQFRKDGIPLDNIVQDWQYWGSDKDGSWSGMIWDKQRFPDPVKLTTTLHNELHVKLMNSIWPSVGNDTELAKELDAKNLRFAPLHWISKKARIYDAFSEEGRAIYFKHIKKGLLDAGVDALWMDGTEVEVGTACHDVRKVEEDIKGLGKNAMGDFTRYLNPYTLVTTKGTYEGQRASGNKRVFTLTRSAFTGQQRYAAVSWSGDTTASWETFRNQISGGVNVAMAGQPYWTQDTGGFFVRHPGGEKNSEYRELFARWHQFGAFNPIYRIHGTNVEREPYIFKNLDPEVFQSIMTANHLRYRLMPYVYSMGWMSTSEGYTMMRGLPMDFPDDLASRKIDDQFMFGSFLVHPITKSIQRSGASVVPTIPAAYLTTPDGAPGLAAEYFQGTKLEVLASSSVDPKVDFTWPGPPLAEPPAGLKSVDDFSARWQGMIHAPSDGEYEIGVEADDGVRLWLDGKLVVEDWSEHPLRYKGVKLTLRKGQKLAVKIEYFNGKFARGLRLAWKPPGEVDPKLELANTIVETYLPSGADWYDFWTNERFTGGQKASRACPLDIFPLYVRAGSIIPMSPVMNYATEKPDAPYEIRIYPGADAKFSIYEDDNETYNYEKGQRATVQLTWDDSAKTLSIGSRQGSYPGLIAKRRFHVTIAAPGQAQGPSEMETGGQMIDYTGKAARVKF